MNNRNDAAGQAVPVITLDGPSGSGKGTISQALAEELGWHYLDSGALYRLLAYAALQKSLDLADEAALVELVGRLSECYRLPTREYPVIELDGVDVSDALRTERCADAASRAAALPGVREALLAWQRRYRQLPGLVADGRDMGTVVFPDAKLKLFLRARPGVRANRRYKQLKEKGKNISLESIVADVKARDERDRSRAVSPLVPAADAHLLDNSALDIEETVARVLDHARSII